MLPHLRPPAAFVTLPLLFKKAKVYHYSKVEENMCISCVISKREEGKQKMEKLQFPHYFIFQIASERKGVIHSPFETLLSNLPSLHMAFWECQLALPAHMTAYGSTSYPANSDSYCAFLAESGDWSKQSHSC